MGLSTRTIPGVWFDSTVGYLPNGEQLPPIGVTPRDIHREQRQTELLRAISEYLSGGFVDDDNRATVLEWIDELREMVDGK